MLERLQRFTSARRTRPGNSPSNHQITRSPNQFSTAGFTMIELLVVLALIVILATMGMTQYRSSVVHAKEAVLKSDLFQMRDALDQYYADKGAWPDSLDQLVGEGYLRKMP